MLACIILTGLVCRGGCYSHTIDTKAFSISNSSNTGYWTRADQFEFTRVPVNEYTRYTLILLALRTKNKLWS